MYTCQTVIRHLMFGIRNSPTLASTSIIEAILTHAPTVIRHLMFGIRNFPALARTSIIEAILTHAPS